ncbi:uncharacterized protein DS421_15g506430 [Arachis hypogaea]|nr:uncharacterized protein DS421_15g506430 [Arachis hypogaea]
MSEFNSTFIPFDAMTCLLSDFRLIRQEWIAKSGRKHVQGRKHEENKEKHTQRSVRVHKEACVRTRKNFHVCERTSTCAYAEVNFQPSVHTHRTLYMISLMKHMLCDF